jgi:hypothetical protein
MTQCSDGNWCCDTTNRETNALTVNTTCCSAHLGINLEPTVVPASSPSSSPSSTGNDVLKIGLSVGLGVGIPLIIALVVLAIFVARLASRRKSPRNDQPPANVMTMPPQSTSANWSVPQPAEYRAIPVYPAASQAQQAPLLQPMYTPVFEAPGHENKGASIGPGNGA